MTVTETSAATLEHLPPATLRVHKANVRSKVDEGLVDSVRQLGVLSPLIVTADNGTYTVVAGHRRRAAAIKAEVATVPCYVLELGDDAKAVTAMLAENLARLDLSPADEAKGFEQLSAFGMTDAEIAAATSVDETIVATGLRVARSKVASKVGRQHDLTLDQSAALAEFEGDAKAVKTLTSTAQKNPGRFDHEVANLRQERERLDKRAKIRAKLQSDGVKINGDNDRPGYDFGSRNGVELASLRDAKGKEITVAAHKDCPGHAAYISHWGESVTYLCRSPKKYGHKSYYSHSASRSSKPELSPAEKEKASAERRTLIANNKAMDVATPVRRRYVKALLARKVAPKGTLQVLADLIVGEHPYWLDETHREVTLEVTGITSTTRGEYGTVRVSLAPFLKGPATDARLQVVLFARVAVAIESTWSRDIWRNKHPRQARYLRYLASTGYVLSDVEQVLIDVAEGKTAKNVAPKPATKKAPAKKAAPVKKAAKKAVAKRVPAKRKAVAKKAR